MHPEQSLVRHVLQPSGQHENWYVLGKGPESDRLLPFRRCSTAMTRLLELKGCL